MFTRFPHPSSSGLDLRRRAGAILLIAAIGGLAAFAGTSAVLQPAPAMAQATTACTQNSDGTVICPPSTGSSTPFSNCYPGQAGYSCTTYNSDGSVTVSNCIQGQAAFSCTTSGQRGASSSANCLTSGSTYSCNITSPGSAPQTTNCMTSSSSYTCANSIAGAPASGYTCLTAGAGHQSCSYAPANAYQQTVVSAGIYAQPAAASTAGQYCTDATGGQIWVSAGSPTDGLSC